MTVSPNRLSIVVFCDACGWDIIGHRQWFLATMQHRQQVTSVYGYSSACIPAILTGRKPNENGHWSSFYYSPETSPFKIMRFLKFLPRNLMDRGRVRHWLSKLVARNYGFTGYFQIYNLPFDVLELFDYAEKRDILRPAGINEGASIFDDLEEMAIPRFVTQWQKSEGWNFAQLREQIDQRKVNFAYWHTAKIDALTHDESKGSPNVDVLLRDYEMKINELLSLASETYDEVRFAFFSDHGMCTVESVVNLQPIIESLDLEFGTDFAGIYDSTMMRFWFLNPSTEKIIRDALPDADFGRWITEQEHKEYGTYWDNGKFGDAVFALEPGYLLNPSHMGSVLLKGMHGYRPDHEDSHSALITNFEPETEINEITDYYHLLKEMAIWAQPQTPSN